MCGILGMVGTSDSGALDLALPTLTNRGPDSHGTMRFPKAHIAHTRLAIVDLSAGHQPMKDPEHDIAITFNGEIYNYRILREELAHKGHTFITQSDTEVILKSYIEYGERCVEKFDGQFAFAIWDNKHERLFLARDRFGEKPLYISHQRTAILFASEIKALLATGLVKKDIDLTSLDNYLSLLVVPPWRSIYKEISPLPPAHYALWEKGIYTQKQYWKLTKNPVELSFEDAAHRVREMLTDSVSSRTIADVEVGAFLSGGIDSSIVVRLAQRLSGRPLKTFSAGLDGATNELPFAQKIAALAKTDHHSVQIKNNMSEVALEVFRYFDEPFADPSCVPTSIISSLAHKDVKTVLSGDGGDELFWGYGQYTHYRHLPKLQQLRNTLTRTTAYDHFVENILTVFSEKEKRRLLPGTKHAPHPANLIDLTEAHTPLEKINLTDFYLGLPGDMLTKIDRASMMHSLEVRSPFLQHELAQFAYNLPPEYKTDGRRGKIILEKAFGDLLPSEFFTRKKQGFGAPVGSWLRTPEFKKLVDEWFTKDARIAEFLEMGEVKGYFNDFYAGNNTLQHKVWSLFTLEGWMRTRL